MHKVQSTVTPEPIEKHKNLVWLRKNIQEVTKDDFGTPMKLYEYDEILIENISLEEAEANFNDIFSNPENYPNILQINGQYVNKE